METITNTLGSLAHSVFGTSPVNRAELSKKDVVGLEETERSRRIEQVSQTRVDKQNAANVSSLIRTQSFPVFRGNLSKGYKRVTHKYEEEERRRRLTNKSESALRRANANKSARMISKLGWPLVHGKGKAEYIYMDATKLMEEEERERRTNDSYWTPSAKHNAATVANMLRLGSFQKNPNTGFNRHLRYLQEKERKDRLRADVMIPSMSNAYNEASLIRHMGPPFYVQTAPKKDFSELNKLQEEERQRRIVEHPEERERFDRLRSEVMLPSMEHAYNEAGLIRHMGAPFYVQSAAEKHFSEINKLEEEERQRRIEHPEERQLATELAGAVSGHLNRPVDLEEQERNRRLKDVNEQQLAKKNAKQVALLVRESSSNKIVGTGPVWFSISRNSMNALAEIERTRRLRDEEGERLSKQHAKQVSDLVLQRWSAPPKRVNFSAIEEEERQARILDRARQQLAVKNARKVSGMIARNVFMSSNSKSYALAMEESERSRRLTNQQEQSMAQENAKKVANLVSSLTLAPGHHVQTRDAPLAHIETRQPLSPTKLSKVASTESLPTFHASTSAAPTTINIPSSTLPVAPSAAAARSAPVTPVIAAPAAPSAPSAPLAAPIASSAAPTSLLSGLQRSSGEFHKTDSPLIAAAPVARAVPTRPLPVSAAPISTAPLAAPVSTHAPLAAPLSSSPMVQPMVLPATAAPVPVAPLASATAMPIRQPSYTSVPLATTPLTATTPLATSPLTYSAPIVATPITTLPIVPGDNIANLHAPLGERERKKLQKQVYRHNKKSEKDVRKAEARMLKAEKMHQKGRDDRALKLEGKAEMLMKYAEHERRWADGIQSELRNAPAPASM